MCPCCNEALYDERSILDNDPADLSPSNLGATPCDCPLATCNARFPGEDERDVHIVETLGHWACFTKSRLLEACLDKVCAIREEQYKHQLEDAFRHPYVCPYDCALPNDF